ncbi:hypothetical protein YC2023_092576 [Brassica napus]
MIGERGREYAFGVKEEDSRDSSSLYLTVIFLPALLSVTTTIIRVLFCSSIVINLSAYIRSQEKQPTAESSSSNRPRLDQQVVFAG